MPTNPQTLIEQSKCYACYGVSQGELLKLALLGQISGGGSGTCANLEGLLDDPTGVQTPTFIGQVYRGPNTIWQSTGLTSADWTLLTDDRHFVLTDVTVDDFVLTDVSSVTLVSFPNLTDVTAFIAGGNLSLNSCSNLASVNFPLLATVAGTVTLANVLPQTLSFPSLTSVGGLSMDSNVVGVVLSVPLLATITGDVLIVSNAMTSFSFPSLITIGAGADFSTNASLSSFSAPNWLPTDGTSISFNGDALDVTSVNLILARCVASGVTTCNIDLSGGTNAAPAGQGILDKATLIGAGNTVLTN